MFEKFDIDDLYYCTITDSVPMGMSNVGGCISIEGTFGNSYETIVWCRGDKYIDINHMDRIINVVHYPQMNFPILSGNKHLYVVCEETLVPYREKIQTQKKSLRRLPLGIKVIY